MHSWVFRHRVRLRVIYGPLPTGPQPGLEPVFSPAIAAEEELALERAGSIERGERFVLLHPMPREQAI
ncbi:MAG: hypothetical protein ACI835_002527 [Planctomycetota bacterium]|jgi:hypothetical protein